MGIYATFGTDASAEKAGVWVDIDISDPEKPIRFLIARQSRLNKKFAAAVDKIIGPYRQQFAHEKVSEETSHKLNLQVFCESILLNWENVTDRDGKEIPFNVGNALKVMGDLHDLYVLLNAKSQSLVVFKDKSLDLVVKN